MSAYRSKVLTNNLVNFDTPGFRRKDVNFDEVLSDAVESGKVVNLEDVKPTIFEPHKTMVDARGNDVDLDKEIGEQLKNSARYRTAMRVMTKLYKQMEQAIDNRS